MISSAMSMARFQYCIRQSAEMENQMTSVDRIIEYGQLPPEATLDTNKSNFLYYPSSFWVFFSDSNCFSKILNYHQTGLQRVLFNLAI